MSSFQKSPPTSASICLSFHLSQMREIFHAFEPISVHFNNYSLVTLVE
jgi:hypothetical protein